ncbi:MAG TPA: AAA family ATPase, partial [Solirubrobacteraceae bacterium]|nr:AAA family ATPase [Solirubrobacteraceae bacterium]
MQATHLSRTGMLDRVRECDALDQLVAGTRAGESGVLVLRGEAGVGKTALLERLVATADGCRIARAAGVESEMELAFAGLHALCVPMLDRVGNLPSPQRDALNTAFGLRVDAPPDRFLVGLAVLSLLADVAEEQPLVCVVDDVQWLDRVSAETLAFVARRLLAERVGLVFALREFDDHHALQGLPELVIEGLPADDASRLLEATIPGPLDGRVRDRILGEAGGNPLALLELSRAGGSISLAGGFGLPGSVPLTSRIEQGFVRQLVSLSADTRQLLVLAAAEPVGDVTLLWRAAERLGIGPEAAGPAEAAGLVEIGARVRFRHPLVRSAAYRAAPVPQRREAHRALAAATDSGRDPDRRAWHRAHATDGPDEAVAGELESSAGRARARGGIAAAAAFLERATELTPDPSNRGARALAAAQANFESAAFEPALQLLEVAQMCPLENGDRARLARLRAEIAFRLRRGNDAPPLLIDAAVQLETVDAAAARETYVEAIGAAMFAAGLYAPAGIRTAADAARRGPPAPQPPRSIDLVLDGMAAWFTEPPAVAAPPLRLALEAFRNEDLQSHEATMRWLLLYPVFLPVIMWALWDDD